MTSYEPGDLQAAIEAVLNDGLSSSKASEMFGVPRRTLDGRIQRARINAAKRGEGTFEDIPAPYMLRGTSTLYDEDGNRRLQWVKTTVDQDRLEAIQREALEAFASTLPREKPAQMPEAVPDDLLNLFVITDYHIGAKAWAEETGADWDVKIAEDLLVRWFQKAIKEAPDAKEAFLGQLGDFLHFDSLEALTPTSGHILDADTRFTLIVRVVIRVLRRIIRMLLEKHEHVYVIMAEGNHDIASSVWLRECLQAFYEDEPRITIDTRPDPYYCHEHGLTSLFFHHGHKKKVKDIDRVFVAKFRQLYGRTKFSYAHMGHLHHEHELESSLMIVRQHRTLAASDAYASRGGWLSGRSADVCTYSKRFGEVQRMTISVDLAME